MISESRFTRGLLGCIGCLLALILLASCAPSTQEAQESDSTEPSQPLTIASMKGPTSIGLAAMMEDEQDEDAFLFEVYASADEITPKLASGDIDIALVPANLAATLYQRTDGGVRVIDVNTLGVLYALTADEQLKGIADLGMADLAGRTIYMTGKGTVPEYTVRCLIEAAGLDEGSITLEFKSEPTEVVALLAADPSAIGILPQPYATAAEMQDANLMSIMDLSEQWDLLALTDDPSAPDQGRLVTGVTVARTEVIEEHEDEVLAFLAAHERSAAQAVDDPASIAEEVVELGIVGSTSIAEKAIPLCNVVCLTGDEMRTALSGYLSALFEMAPEAIGGALPPEDFYFLG